MTGWTDRYPAAERLAPLPGEVQVWWWALPAGGLAEEVRAGLAVDAGPAAAARAARMRRPADTDRVLAAHALLRRLVAPWLGLAPGQVECGSRCLPCGLDDHGKPYLLAEDGSPAPWEFNLTHSGQLVAVALAAAGTAVGVDVEQRRPALEWASLQRVFAEPEWQATAAAADPAAGRLALWARKEAALKATGHGLSLPLASVQVTGTRPIDQADAARWVAVLPERAAVAAGVEVAGLQLALDADHAAAVAAVLPVGSPLPVTVRAVHAE